MTPPKWVGWFVYSIGREGNQLDQWRRTAEERECNARRFRARVGGESDICGGFKRNAERPHRRNLKDGMRHLASGAMLDVVAGITGVEMHTLCGHRGRKQQEASY